MPTTSNVLVATYADDTGIIASNDCQILASRDVQDEIDLLQDWFKKWNIKVTLSIVLRQLNEGIFNNFKRLL